LTAESYDVVVVGARCAGAPLATLLARRGVHVALVERAVFPRDTLSSHAFESDALAFLGRLGLTDRLRATGARFASRIDMRLDDFRMEVELPQRPGDIGGVASIRRHVLDPILADAAAEAGAEVYMGAGVAALIEEDGGVAGVGLDDGRELRARLVVGADGRDSTVAKLTRARAYNLTPNQRGLYWAYFESAQPPGEPTFLTHRWGDRFVLGLPTDAGLYQAMVWPELHQLDAFKRDLEASFMEYARACEPLARALDGARRVDKIVGSIRWTGYFREPSGPGWVLTGDAGHFKDPGPGRGIGDAFIQADELAPRIADALQRSPAQLDAAMADFGRWRDHEFAEHYWLAVDSSAAGELPAVLPEVVKRMHEQGEQDQFLDLLSHRNKPSKVLTPPRVLGATARALAKRRRGVLKEVATLAKQDRKRRRLNKHPAFA
jgi:flavin-dependent dehydrogenase